jgi:hypothetical protein
MLPQPDTISALAGGGSGVGGPVGAEAGLVVAVGVVVAEERPFISGIFEESAGLAGSPALGAPPDAEPAESILGVIAVESWTPEPNGVAALLARRLAEGRKRPDLVGALAEEEGVGGGFAMSETAGGGRLTKTGDGTRCALDWTVNESGIIPLALESVYPGMWLGAWLEVRR